MPIAIVLSGGGSRGDFEIGALRFIYDQGIRPDILCGTSVGAINAIKLAEDENPDNPQQGLTGLEAIWESLQQNTDMYLEEDWLNDPNMDPRVRDVLLGRARDLNISVPNANAYMAWGDIGQLIYMAEGLVFLVGDGQAILRSLDVFVSRARALYNLRPIALRLVEMLDTERLAAWAASGKRLRLGIVGLNSGRLRWVTEMGDVIEYDGTPVPDFSDIPFVCRPLADEVARIETEISTLQEDLRTAPTNARPQIISQIRAQRDALSAARANLDRCLTSQRAQPLRLPNIRLGY
ncbi:MAG: patatin-like phospholipase family protein [Candidatus Entotheonellia bacterium]